MSEQELYNIAMAAREKAWAPYSGFRVGAALLAASGRVYAGCNIENAAYSATVCAERTALFTAVAAGERQFSALCIVGGAGEAQSLTPPCGVCRQALREFCDPEMPILLFAGEGCVQRCTLGQLLPLSFGSEQLAKGE